jgi:hypothetical protein
MTALQFMYLAAILGSGIAGAVVLFAPAVAMRYVFLSEVADDHVTRVLGAAWLGLGLISLVGIEDPIRYSPVLALQMVAMAAWLLFDGAPGFLAGRSDRAHKIYSAVFAVWVAALILTLPFDYLAG